jgi:hypothetical protein
MNLKAVNLMEAPAELLVGLREAKKDVRRDAAQGATRNRNGGERIRLPDDHRSGPRQGTL